MTDTTAQPDKAETRTEYVVQHQRPTTGGAEPTWGDHHITPDMTEAKRTLEAIGSSTTIDPSTWRVIERRTTIVEDVLP